MVRKKNKTPPPSRVKERDLGLRSDKVIPVYSFEDVRREENMKLEDSMRKLREENTDLSQKLSRTLDMEKRKRVLIPSYPSDSELLAANSSFLGDNPNSRSTLEEMKVFQNQYRNEPSHQHSNTRASLEERRVLHTQNLNETTQQLVNSSPLTVQIQKGFDGKTENQKKRQSMAAVSQNSSIAQEFTITSDDLSLVLVDPQPSPIAQISPSFDGMNDSQLAEIEAIIHQKKEERLKNALLKAREEALNSIDIDHGAWITTTRGSHNSGHVTTQYRSGDLLNSGHGRSHTADGASLLTIQSKENNVLIEEVNEKEEGEIIEGNDAASSDTVDRNGQEDPNGVGILGVIYEDENSKGNHDTQTLEGTVSKDSSKSSQAEVQDKETQKKLSWASLVGRANGIGDKRENP